MSTTVERHTGASGAGISRVDGPAKVSGQARYCAEFAPEHLAHAALVSSTIPRGRIARIGSQRAASAPGVLAVITHENAPRLPYVPLEHRPQVDPASGDQLKVFQGPEVCFNGQPIAVVVAETLEEARAAAELVEVAYEPAEACTVFDASHGVAPSDETAKSGRPAQTSRGDATAALKTAAVCIEATYIQHREHHNAMEPHVTIASWDADRLTLYDKTQWVNNTATAIAHVFGIPVDHVRVISPFVGGAFGSGLRTWPHVTIAALAASKVGRPVRLELTRRELYTAVGFRPHTEQHVALGADRNGRLQAIVHEAAGQTSVYEDYAEMVLDPARNTYSCPNVHTRYRLVRQNINSPCPMRAPGIVTGLLALEIAMDELAVALQMDPLELRLRNHAERDEHRNLPWSSKELKACYHAAAERFGWARRDPRPRSMQRGHELIGYGMATATYHSERAAASASATLLADGTAKITSASSDMGPGTYTSMTQVAADALGLPIERVHFELGDTQFPTASVHGGSITMASIGNAVLEACHAVQKKLIQLSCAAQTGPFSGCSPEDLVCREGGIARKARGSAVTSYAELLWFHNLEHIESQVTSQPSPDAKRYSSSAFGAVFVEVRVDRDLGTIRVPRMVGAYDVGRVINPKIARSQCLGGMVGGLGMALLESAEWDARFGRVMNANLAEYLVPVCADVRELEVIFVPGNDTRFNPLGVKGLAEIAICGVAPAIANAVFHATGRRIRELPILPERLLMS
jgi:xanthine dehydrogenase YagR molybdenum-binding subunit